MDEVTQRDQIRLVGLWDAQSKWSQCQAGLTLAAACAQAEEQADDPSVSPARSLIAEAALACGKTSYSAHALARVGAAGLNEPILAEAMMDGVLGVSTGDVILRAAGRLEDPESRRLVLSHGIRLAKLGQTRPRIQDGCEKLAADQDPAGCSHAHQVAYEERSIHYRSRSAAMATLTVFGAAHELARITDLVETASQRGHPKDLRTAGQRRYDALIALLDHTPYDGGPAPHDGVAGPDSAGSGSEVSERGARRPGPPFPKCGLLVRMDATTLLGLDDKPGLILGAGPIPAEVGRAIAVDATWRALFVDPASGRPVWVSDKAFSAGMVFGARARPPGGPGGGGSDGGGSGGGGSGGDSRQEGAGRYEETRGAGPPDREDGSSGRGSAGDGENSLPATGGGDRGDRGAMSAGRAAGDGSERSQDGSGAGPPGIGLAEACVNPWGEPEDWPMETASNNSYQPSLRVRRLLAVRQSKCANPTCGRCRQGCEVDHLDPYNPGQPADQQTKGSNLQHLSKGCHELKTRFGWEYHRDVETGETTIRTPLGLVYQVPADRLD
jgi:hypothetical protein